MLTARSLHPVLLANIQNEDGTVGDSQAYVKHIRGIESGCLQFAYDDPVVSDMVGAMRILQRDPIIIVERRLDDVTYQRIEHRLKSEADNDVARVTRRKAQKQSTLAL